MTQSTALKFEPPALTEQEVRRDLAHLYNFIAGLGMDDMTYTHMSARHPTEPDAFLINPFGLFFEEVTPESLVVLDFEGRAKGDYPFNKTGYRIHGDIYKANPHLNCAIHLHTTAGVAVSNMKEGLLPLSQFSFHFYEKTAYHEYDGLALGPEEGKRIAENLGQGNVAMFLRNHGTMTVGTTIQEAFLYTYFLERACEVQVATLSQGREIEPPSPETCRKARDQMRAFEPDFGRRDWEAMLRVGSGEA